MKKTIFCLAAGVMALTACTSTDVVEEGIQGNAIGFQNYVSKESRALATDNLKFFSVYGYYVTENNNTPVIVFDGQEVTRTDVSSNKWTYNPARYWVPEATYRFYAYSCEGMEFTSANGQASLGSGADVTGRALRLRNVKCDGNHQHDLIFATNDEGITGSGGDTNTNEPVAFKFKHILSKINVVFESGFPKGYTITVSNVKIKNFNDRGNYNPTSGWTKHQDADQNDAAVISLAIANDANTAAVATDNAEAKTVSTGIGYVIPYHYSDADTSNDEAVGLEFHVVIKNANGDDVLTNTLTGSWYPNWVAGYSYTYKVKINGDAAALYPIVFETAQSVDDWTTGSTGSVTMEFSAN
ncbi:MAG: fimbrillin family protein [Muribaculaceae bacterium]|nr:fimbrillin family protein [Muribaculaceae bacterium]